MKIKDFLEASEHKLPYQDMSVRPVQHYDDMEKDGTNDFVVTMIVGNKQLAYRVNTDTALQIDAAINRALQLAVRNGSPVNLFTAKPEDEHEVEKQY